VDLQILQKTYDMMLYAHPALNQYPRSEKHTLAANIKVTMLNMVRLATRANKERRKIEFLRELDAELELLRTQVRVQWYTRMYRYSTKRLTMWYSSHQWMRATTSIWVWRCGRWSRWAMGRWARKCPYSVL
jgi:hypothetical protein